jgi:hypothetical protein
MYLLIKGLKAAIVIELFILLGMLGAQILFPPVYAEKHADKSVVVNGSAEEFQVASNPSMADVQKSVPPALR